jgi:hypothetical protein
MEKGKRKDDVGGQGDGTRRDLPGPSDDSD